nr:uncharacterized protein LOC122321521 [Drosophila bipectinata]
MADDVVVGANPPGSSTKGVNSLGGSPCCCVCCPERFSSARSSCWIVVASWRWSTFLAEPVPLPLPLPLAKLKSSSSTRVAPPGGVEKRLLDVGGEGCERLRSSAKCLGWMAWADAPVPAAVGEVMLTSGTQRAVTLYRLPLPTATPTLTPAWPLERISHKSLASRFLILFRLMWFVVVAVLTVLAMVVLIWICMFVAIGCI